MCFYLFLKIKLRLKRSPWNGDFYLLIFVKLVFSTLYKEAPLTMCLSRCRPYFQVDLLLEGTSVTAWTVTVGQESLT